MRIIPTDTRMKQKTGAAIDVEQYLVTGLRTPRATPPPKPILLTVALVVTSINPMVDPRRPIRAQGFSPSRVGTHDCVGLQLKPADDLEHAAKRQVRFKDRCFGPAVVLVPRENLPPRLYQNWQTGKELAHLILVHRDVRKGEAAKEAGVMITIEVLCT